MFKLFKVGETAHIRNTRTCPHLNGSEVEVIGGFKLYTYFDNRLKRKRRSLSYRVRLIDAPYDQDYFAGYSQLYRKKSPTPVTSGSTPASWNDSPWKPEGISAKDNTSQ